MTEHTIRQLDVLGRPVLVNAQKLPPSMGGSSADNNNNTPPRALNAPFIPSDGQSPAPSFGARATSDPAAADVGSSSSVAAPHSTTWNTRPHRRPYNLPLVSGYLWMSKNGGKWKRLWCEYLDGIFTFRNEETQKRPNGVLEVSYCEAEKVPQQIRLELTAPNGLLPNMNVNAATPSNNANNAAAKNPNAPPDDPLEHLSTAISSLTLNPSSGNASSAAAAALHQAASTSMRYTELYWSYLASSTLQQMIADASKDVNASNVEAVAKVIAMTQQPTPTNTALPRQSSLGNRATSHTPAPPSVTYPLYTFRLWSSGRVYLFRADTPETRNEFVDTIRRQLIELVSSSVWQEKQVAAHVATPMLREQFVLQLHRYQLLVKALNRQGIQEDDLPITSTRKDKSGVLCMETPYDVTRWRDYYFVLFEGGLFYYKDSKSTTPTGFVTLKYASIQLDTRRLTRDEYVFRVVTPWRTVICRTKHAVALSEWISVLETTLYQQSAAGSGGKSSRVKPSRSLSDNNSMMPRQSSGGSVEPNSPASPVKRQQSAHDGATHSATENGQAWSSTTRQATQNNLLSDINRIVGDVSSFDALCNNVNGLENYRNCLRKQHAPILLAHLNFYVFTAHLLTLPQAPTLQQQQSFSSNQPQIPTAPPTAAAAAAANAQTAAAMTKFVKQLLNATFTKLPPLNTHNEVFNYALAIHDEFICPFQPLSNPTASSAIIPSVSAHDDHHQNPMSLLNHPNYFHDLNPNILADATAKLHAYQQYGQISHSYGLAATNIMGSIVAGIFDPIRRMIYSQLVAQYASFTLTRDFHQYMIDPAAAGQNAASGDSRSDGSHAGPSAGGNSILLSNDNREVAPFDSSLIPQFMLKIKGTKESKSIKLSKKANVLTIGRDKSNTLILEDSRVSRSHARIEWHENECMCEYIDLGSSCGSKLNGKPVQRARLQPGDVLELGQSTLVFQLKRKKGRFGSFF